MTLVRRAPEAPNLAATLNQGVFNVGNLSWGVSYANLPLVSAALALLAVAVAVMSQALDRPASATIRQAPAE
jgi:MFS transporter, DHA1 family, inner membrane transport protein